MALKTTKITPTRKITVHTVSEALPRAHYQRCPQCDTLFALPEMKSHQSAFCPRCDAKVRDGRDWSLTRLAAMAVTMLLLMPFAWSEPLLKLYLLGVRIDANVLQGIWQMTRQGSPLTAAMVLFCTVGAPLVLVAAIAYLWFGNILGMNLRPVLLMLEKLKEWVMLDIYLVGVGVASIKVQDYAFLQPGIGLFAFISLVLLSILTLIHLNVEQLWERFYPQRPATRPDENLRVCLGCHYTGLPDARGRCPRCHIPLTAAAQAQPAKMLGGADRLPGVADPGQPAADFHHLREWRASGGYHPLRDYLACAQQCRGGGDRLYRQYSGALYQGGGDVYPAHQHSL